MTRIRPVALVYLRHGDRICVGETQDAATPDPPVLYDLLQTPR